MRPSTSPRVGIVAPFGAGCPLLFSAQFEVTRAEADSWFDPILDHDTKLFIDPFLIFDNPLEPFDTAHSKVIGFFNAAFTLAAETTGEGVRMGKLRSMMLFPEPSELCLGYTSMDTGGSGTGSGQSQDMIDGVFQSLSRGIQKYSHFEEVSLFHMGIGCDRISDVTANILKEELTAYTQSVCKHHRIPTTKVRLRNGRFNYATLRWNNPEVLLPVNPNSGKPVLLVPEVFLKTLPTINPNDFFDWAWSNENTRLREDFGFEVKSHVRKADIIRVASTNREWVDRYMAEAENRESMPYDLTNDPDGLYQWERTATQYVTRRPLKFTGIHTEKRFLRAVNDIVAEFKHSVEEEGLWQLLWDGSRAKPELASQLLFRGIVKHYCIANNIDLSREIETGRGPVDFKFSLGYANRALLEAKLASNTKFWNGITKQLPAYLWASQCKNGVFLVFVTDKKQYNTIVPNIQNQIAEANKQHRTKMVAVVVDATPKRSASKL